MNLGPSPKPSLPAKPAAWSHNARISGRADAERIVATTTLLEAASELPYLRVADDAFDPARTRRDAGRASSLAADASPPQSPPSPGASVRSSRRNWLAKMALHLQVEPEIANLSIAQLSESRTLSYLGQTHRPFMQRLARQVPDWAHLPLAQLYALLAGDSFERADAAASPRQGERDVAAKASTPLLMVTVPGEHEALAPNALEHLRRRFSAAPAHELLTGPQTVQRERAWLHRMVHLLRLPYGSASLPPAPQAGQRAPNTMPASLADKLAEQGIDWRNTCVLELVELALALGLVT